jgi:hypothetical protein
MESFEHDEYLFIDGVDKPERPYGRIFVETRKDLATGYCRRLLIATAFVEGCVFDTPWTLAGYGMHHYRNVTEIIITSKAIEETDIARQKQVLDAISTTIERTEFLQTYTFPRLADIGGPPMPKVQYTDSSSTVHHPETMCRRFWNIGFINVTITLTLPLQIHRVLATRSI